MISMLSENEAKCSLPERLIINLDHIQAGKWGGGFYWRGASIRENTVLSRSFGLVTDRRTDTRTESDAYEPTVQCAQVGSKSKAIL